MVLASGIQNAVNKKRLTPLDVATDNGIVHMLVEAGAKSNCVSKTTQNRQQLVDSYVVSPPRKSQPPKLPGEAAASTPHAVELQLKQGATSWR